MLVWLQETGIPLGILLGVLAVGYILWTLRGRWSEIEASVKNLSDKLDSDMKSVTATMKELKDDFKSHDNRVDKMSETLFEIKGYVDSEKRKRP